MRARRNTQEVTEEMNGRTTGAFAPTFTVSRVAGWTAHCFEQRALDRLIRPQSEYVGAEDRAWVPLGER